MIARNWMKLNRPMTFKQIKQWAKVLEAHAQLSKKGARRTAIEMTRYMRDKRLKRVYLVGSRAKGIAGPLSDVDFLVRQKGQIQPLTFGIGANITNRISPGRRGGPHIDIFKGQLRALRKKGNWTFSEDDVAKWFEKRFKKSPQSDPSYFQEWVGRFQRGKPEVYMDSDGIAVFKKVFDIRGHI